MSEDEMITFLAAQLTEDEAAARAVKPLGYVSDMGGTRLDEKFSHGRIRFASEDGRSCIEGDAAAASHFARHDPARVLREVAAKREILAEHRQWVFGGMTGCSTCHAGHEVGDPPPGPCPTLRALAAVYSDHPGYRAEWKPSGGQV